MSGTEVQAGRDLVKVLDNGFVKLVEFMGGDGRAVESARVSFGSVSKGEAADRKLIEYLLEHGHFSPFEHSVFQFHIKCPIFVARQWMRHRIASYNEISARYTEVHDEFYFPSEFRAQDRSNRQGSLPSANLDQKRMLEIYDKAIKSAYASYKELLDAGAAREMARLVLPVAQYTQFYWSINARSLLNFISLRADSHAQWEIRRYAEAIQGMFREKMPWTWEAWTKLNDKKAH